MVIKKIKLDSQISLATQHTYLPDHISFASGSPLLKYISWSVIEIVLMSLLNSVVNPKIKTSVSSCL